MISADDVTDVSDPGHRMTLDIDPGHRRTQDIYPGLRRNNDINQDIEGIRTSSPDIVHFIEGLFIGYMCEYMCCEFDHGSIGRSTTDIRIFGLFYTELSLYTMFYFIKYYVLSLYTMFY